MYTRSLIVGSLAVALSTAALAQTPATMPGDNSGAARTADKVSTSGDWWLASKLPKVDVYNATNDKIGDISDLVIDHDGKASLVIISVGGFLGMGTHNVGVPYNEVKWIDQPISGSANSNNNGSANRTNLDTMPTGTTTTINNSNSGSNASNWRGYPDHVVVNMTKDQLKAAPEFKYTR